MAQQPRKNFDPVPRVYAIENSKFALTAKKLENGDFPPKLSFKMWFGNPRLEFRAGFKYGNGGDGAMFLARMDIPIATTLLNIVRDYAESDKEQIEPIAITCGTEKPGGKPWEIEHNTRVYVGKDSNGVFINPINKGSSYNIKFYIVPSAYHKFIDSNNKPADMSIVSKYYAAQWAKNIIDLLVLYSHETSYRGALDENNIALAQNKKSNKNDNGGGNQKSNNVDNSDNWSDSNDDWD